MEPLYLSRYFDVMRDKLPSQFMLSRSVKVDFGREAPLSGLWELHDEAMESFREKFDAAPGELAPAEMSLLDLKSAIADRILESCSFCERRCGAK